MGIVQGLCRDCAGIVQGLLEEGNGEIDIASPTDLGECKIKRDQIFFSSFYIRQV